MEIKAEKAFGFSRGLVSRAHQLIPDPGLLPINARTALRRGGAHIYPVQPSKILFAPQDILFIGQRSAKQTRRKIALRFLAAPDRKDRR